MERDRVTIVGAGLAGLSAASYLKRNGFSVTLVEASDRIGGILATDHVDGFTLDHGFQVVLDSYPEFRRLLDRSRLSLKRFDKGVDFVDSNMERHSFFDPRSKRDPRALRSMLRQFHPRDLLAIARLGSKTLFGDPKLAFEMLPETSLSYLHKNKLSTESIERFFKPFFGAVLLDDSLETQARMMVFSLANFLQGTPCIPEGGMGEIPSQIAESIPHDSIRLGTRVTRFCDVSVETDHRDVLDHDYLILATKSDDLATLTGDGTKDFGYRAVVNHYYASESDLRQSAAIMIPSFVGSGVASLAIMDAVSKSYAPPGTHLISISSLDATSSAGDHQATVAKMLGIAPSDLSPLASYRIDRALPKVFGSGHQGEPYFMAHSQRVFLAGDFMENPSIDGAIASGRKAAEAVMFASSRYGG